MSNIDLAKVILIAMWHLATMVVAYQRGDMKHGDKAQERFIELGEALYEMDGEVDE